MEANRVEDLLGKEAPVTMISISELIRNMPRAHLTFDVVQSIHRMIDSAMTSLRLQNLQRDRMKLEAARVVATNAAMALEACTTRLTRARDYLESIPAESWTKAILYLVCATIGFGAEFALTYATLPYILSVPQESILGILLSAAPASAMVVLDIVLLRVIEEPYQRRGGAGRWSGRIRVALMAAVLLAVAALSLYMVLILADVREQTTIVHTLVNSGASHVELDKNMLKWAIRAVSAMVAVSGGVFLLYGLLGLGRLSARRRAQHVLNSTQTEYTTLQTGAEEAAIKLAALESTTTEQANELHAADCQFQRDHLETQLAEALERDMPELPVSESVKRTLSRMPAMGSSRRSPLNGYGQA